jgi:hypothetical protein
MIEEEVNNPLKGKVETNSWWKKLNSCMFYQLWKNVIMQ